MIVRLDHAVEQIAIAQTKEQLLSLKVLEAQVNPHFLYNSLDAMRWEAMATNNPRLINMIDSLAVFYRMSLSKGNSILTVEQELKLVGV